MPQGPVQATWRPSVAAVVLDTNAVLDWLVFADAGMATWASAILGQTLRWMACERMREELDRTLGYAQLARWQPDRARVLAAFDRHALMCAAPLQSCAPGLQCSDPDDQIFLDLALQQGARWLVPHDRALHRLARKAKPKGLHIVSPAHALAWPQV